MKKYLWLMPTMLCIYTFIYSLTHLTTINQITQSTLAAIFQLIPSLFFLMFLFGVMNQMGLFGLAGFFLEKILNPLLHLGTRASGLYAASLFAGYPTFALLIGQAYERQEIDAAEMKHLMRISSHASPAFVLLSIGSGLFHSLKMGLVIWLIHILSNLILALIFRPASPGKKLSWESCLEGCASTAFVPLCQRQLIQCVRTFVYIYGFMLIFNVLQASLFSHLPGSAIFHGLLEFSAGSLDLANQPERSIFVLVSLFLGFSGISCMMQVQAVLSHIQWAFQSYFIARLFQGLIAFSLSFFYLWLS